MEIVVVSVIFWALVALIDAADGRVAALEQQLCEEQLRSRALVSLIGQDVVVPNQGGWKGVTSHMHAGDTLSVRASNGEQVVAVYAISDCSVRISI